MNAKDKLYGGEFPIVEMIPIPSMDAIFQPEEKSIIFQAMCETWGNIADDAMSIEDARGRKIPATPANIVDIVFDAGYMVTFGKRSGMTQELYNRIIENYLPTVRDWAIKAWRKQTPQV